MSDIFISYSSQDREWVCELAESLEKYGLSVWWDPEIKPGEVYQKVIQNALDNANCVIVVWSQKSAESLWVQSEASQAIERDVLIPLVREKGARFLCHLIAFRQLIYMVGMVIFRIRNFLSLFQVFHYTVIM